MDDERARELIETVDRRLERAEADPIALEVVEALLELYGEGMRRIVESDAELAERLAGDELVSHLLLVHDLHPVPLRERVQAALDEVRPYLDSHGGDVELLGVEAGVVTLRMAGSCNGCASSAATLELAIEEAIHGHAPEVEEVRAEAMETAPKLLQIELPRAPATSRPAWSMAGGVPEIPGGGPVLKTVSGEPVLFVRLGERYYAYRPACPACGQSLESAALDGARLGCPGCATAFDVRHAGRSADPDVHLDPVPLLVDEDGLVRVALGSAVAR